LLNRRNQFKHFTFYLTKYKNKLYLGNHLINISEVNKFEEREELKKVALSADENGYILCKGKIHLDTNSATKKEILDCILSSPITIGVEDHSSLQENNSPFESVSGKWEYTYYVNDDESFAGIIEFKYQFTIYDGYIDYKYYNFIHSKDDSEFESIGKLPLEFNDAVSKVFTQTQYKEITEDLFLNQILAVKRTKNYTNKCFH